MAVLLTAVQNSYFGSTEDYKARFVDASGLIAGSDVRIAGVRVGQVTDVQLVDRDTAEVIFKVDRPASCRSARSSRSSTRTSSVSGTSRSPGATGR